MKTRKDSPSPSERPPVASAGDADASVVVVGEGPAVALGQQFLTSAQATGVVFESAVQQQGRLFVQAVPVTAKEVSVHLRRQSPRISRRLLERLGVAPPEARRFR